MPNSSSPFGGVAAPVPTPPPVYAPGAPPVETPRPPKKGPNQFVTYHDNVIPLWTQWDVPTAMAALDAHALGNFNQSGQLADAMTIDDAFDSVIQTRILGLISRPFHLEPSKKGNKAKARIARRDIADRWDQILPEETQTALMHWWLLMGFVVAQVVWGYEDGLWVPTEIQIWHPSNLWYDLSTRSFVANTQEGPVWIQPGTGQWILLAPWGRYRGWLRGAVRSVSIPWLARQYALRDWSRYSEVHGLPIKKAKVPSGADGQDKQDFVATVGNLGNETTVLLPQGIGGDPALGYDIDLLEAKADTWEAFEGLITKCETRIAIRLLGQNLTTDVDAGSLAAANVHDRVRLDYTRFDAKAMGPVREQLLGPFCSFNYGDPDLAPIPTWNCKPAEDTAAKSHSISEISVAAANFASSGAPVDQRRLLEQNGVPVLPEGEEPSPPTDPGEKPQKAPGGPSGVTRAGLSAAARHPALEAQIYIDAVADKAKARALRELGPHRNAVLAAIRGAHSYEDLRERLKQTMKRANPTQLAKLVERAIVIGELAGRYAVAREQARARAK